ncbi:MAG: VCBS repeat-containing protein, partial [Calditrichaeota bacterium]|nr:VCBS repeat-containing protein [Calditrichota bacterium]
MLKQYVALIYFGLLHLLSIFALYAQQPLDGENEYRLAAVNPLANSIDTLTQGSGRGIWVADNPDLDNDGKPEILVTDYQNGGRIFVYEMEGDDALELVWVSPKLATDRIGGGSTPRSVTTGDFDNNGRQEIIFTIGYIASDTSEFSDRGIYFYEWTGTDNDYGTEPAFHMSFESIDPNFETADVGRTESGLRCEDIDGDGKNELLFPPRSFNFAVAKMYILEVESGTFAGGNAVIENEYVYDKMVQPPNIAPDGYVPCGIEIGDVDSDGLSEIIVAGWRNIASGAGIGFIQIDGADTYTPGSIVDITSDFSAFIVKAKPLFAVVNGNPVIYLHGTDAASLSSKMWVVKDIVSDALVTDANVFELFTDIGLWSAWALGDQDHPTISAGDGLDLYVYGGEGKILDIEYGGSGDVANTANYEIQQIFDLDDIYDNRGGLFNDFFTYPGMDLDGDGNRDIVASYKGSISDTLNGEPLDVNGRHIFVLEWGDSTESINLVCQGSLPDISTNSATNVNTTSAIFNGLANPNGTDTDVFFEYGTTASYGNTILAIQSPVGGTGAVTVSAEANGLDANTTYHFRLVGTNCAGSDWGADQTFVTLPSGSSPVAATNAATNIGSTSATLNATVNPNGLSTTVTFEWGETTAYGNTIAATPSPISGT